MTSDLVLGTILDLADSPVERLVPKDRSVASAGESTYVGELAQTFQA